MHWRAVAAASTQAAVLMWLFLMATGCAERGRPLVIDKTEQRKPVLVVRNSDVRSAPNPERDEYVVGKGDTVYRIAWRFGRTVEAIASANGLEPPYAIFPGQRLRVQGAVTPSAPGLQSGDASAAGTLSTGIGGSLPPVVETPSGPVRWSWPVPATPLREFGRGNKGLDFEVAVGTTVRAAGTGVVVYSGVGLGGYESLLILRHDGGFLSAYSLNCAVAPKEGDVLKAGDPIADISSGGRAARFHFEIRRDGDPVSPRTLLK